MDGRVFERYSRRQRVADVSVGRVWSFHDVTARTRAEDAVRRANEELENRVRERTHEIKETQARLLLSDHYGPVPLVEADEARLGQVESELGTGSVFRVRLPAASADSSVQAVPDSVEPASGRRGKILVVDDDAILAGTLRACSQSILRSGAVTT